MKQLLIFLFAIVSLTAKSQVIDTSFKSITACKIIPFKAKWTDTVNVTHLGARIISDNLSYSCTIYWVLMDSTGTVHVDGNATISGDDYKSWGGDNIFPFSFVGKLYQIIFVKPQN